MGMAVMVAAEVVCAADVALDLAAVDLAVAVADVTWVALATPAEDAAAEVAVAWAADCWVENSAAASVDSKVAAVAEANVLSVAGHAAKLPLLSKVDVTLAVANQAATSTNRSVTITEPLECTAQFKAVQQVRVVAQHNQLTAQRSLAKRLAVLPQSNLGTSLLTDPDLNGRTSH
jgi:hypothetical protein